MGGVKEEIINPLRTFPGKGLGSIYGNNVASGINSFAVGTNNQATGDYSFAVGADNESTSAACITIGVGNKAISNGSVAIGYYNNCEGSFGIAMGLQSSVGIGTQGAFAVGQQCEANGSFSFVTGIQNKAAAISSMVIGGQNNEIQSTTANGCVIIGCDGFVYNGSEQYKTFTNELELVKVGGYLYMYSPDGNRWKIQMTNAGTLAITLAP